ncbi:MAG: hypothetical protein V3U92_19505 [Cellulophaga sp.]
MDKLKGLKLEKHKKAFPVVMRHNRGDGVVLLEIVYSNRTEHYRLNQTETKAEIEQQRSENDCSDVEWNGFQEVEMLKDNGFRRVRDSESKLHED